MASVWSPQPSGDVGQFPVAAKTRPRASSTDGDDHTSTHPVPAPAWPPAASGSKSQRSSPVVAANATRPAR